MQTVWRPKTSQQWASPLHLRAEEILGMALSSFYHFRGNVRDFYASPFRLKFILGIWILWAEAHRPLTSNLTNVGKNAPSPILHLVTHQPKGLWLTKQSQVATALTAPLNRNVIQRGESRHFQIYCWINWQRWERLTGHSSWRALAQWRCVDRAAALWFPVLAAMTDELWSGWRRRGHSPRGFTPSARKLTHTPWCFQGPLRGHADESKEFVSCDWRWRNAHTNPKKKKKKTENTEAGSHNDKTYHIQQLVAKAAVSNEGFRIWRLQLQITNTTCFILKIQLSTGKKSKQQHAECQSSNYVHGFKPSSPTHENLFTAGISGGSKVHNRLIEWFSTITR